MSRITEFALEHSILETLEMEDLAVEALQEAASWRATALMAIAELATQQQRADLLEKRLRQIMGIDPWHTPQEMES